MFASIVCMPLLQLSALSLSIASTQLFEGADAIIVPGQRIGLTGRNGSGKSTLLRALYGRDADAARAASDAKEEEGAEAYFAVTSGEIGGDLAPDAREEGSVLYVSQEGLSWSDLLHNVAEEAELRELTVEDALGTALAYGCECAADDEDTWRRVLAANGTALSWDVSGYSETPIGSLSPGSALRAYLAIALHRPGVQLILCDEPTNHLDLPSVLWLQHSIIASGKSFVIVSHDEAFLDAVADHIWEIDADKQQLTTTGSSYSAYKHAKLMAIEAQRKAYADQQKRHKKLSAVADRLRDASAAGARHEARDHDLLQRDFRRDRAGRSGKKAAAVEKFRDSVEAVERVVDRPPMRFELDPVGAGLDSAIKLDEVVLGWSDSAPLPVAPVTLRIDYGERIALIGFNGVGKSTLLRTMLGDIPPLRGTVSVGRELRIGNVMQAHESLPRSSTPREIVGPLSDLDPFAAGNRLINSFGLTRFQVDQRVAELNPGARARLLLATFQLRRVNALFLDEPTNHLDIEAVKEIVGTLGTFEGTLVVVSHDRGFLQDMELTSCLTLSGRGLTRVESVEEFVEDVQGTVSAAVAATFRA